ncbi:MAG: glycosyltransferase [Prevotella sp.]
MKDLISVIVITYNEEKTIARTLDSILMQKCSMPIEIVIGEDNSTDGTRAICEDYARRYPDIIRLMEKTPNKGIIDNYFDCLLACNGKYIADCDGDDFWITADKLEKQREILDNNPNVVLVHTDWRYYNEETHATSSHKPQPFTDMITKGDLMTKDVLTYTGGFIIHLCTAMFRADAMLEAYRNDTLLFRNKAFKCEDKQVSFAMTLKGDIAFLPEITLHYSYGKPSACNKKDERKQYYYDKSMLELDSYISKHYGLYDKDIEKLFDNRIFGLAMHALRCHDKQLRNDSKACAKTFNIRKSPKTKLVYALMSNSSTWRLALIARNIFIKLKNIRAFH